MDPRSPSLPDAWQRAVGFATAAPDGTEALLGILTEAVTALGARAAAVYEGRSAAFRAVWGCDPEELRPLLQEGGAVWEALIRPDEWGEESLVLPYGEEAALEPPGEARVLLAPLRLRAVGVGALVVVYASPASLPAEGREVAGMFAGLAALVLEQDRLYEEARQARQARDHFLTALNHELRTPATAFILTADLLRYEAGSSLSPRLDQALQETESHVHQLIGVLQRVLDLGRLGGERSARRGDIVQPRDVVAELMRRVEPTAKRKNLVLALFVPRGLPTLQTDEGRFSRILLHLLSNAIKYTSQGRIEVRLERVLQRLHGDRPEPVLAVRVRDTGRGIPTQELERMLEPFTQVDEGARSDSRARGLGLGLPLARELARSLGGEVRIESVLGQGTTASLLLPYHHQEGGSA